MEKRLLQQDGMVPIGVNNTLKLVVPCAQGEVMVVELKHPVGKNHGDDQNPTLLQDCYGTKTRHSSSLILRYRLIVDIMMALTVVFQQQGL